MIYVNVSKLFCNNKPIFSRNPLATHVTRSAFGFTTFTRASVPQNTCVYNSHRHRPTPFSQSFQLCMHNPISLVDYQC